MTPTGLSWIRQLGQWIAGAAAFLGPWGVFVIALADSAFIPMPQGVDALLVAQAIATPEIAYLAAGLGALGSVVGSTVLYFLARGVGQGLLLKRLSANGINRLRRLMATWGAALLIPVAMIPLPMPMKPVVLAAGVFRMPLVSFWSAISFSRLVRYLGMAYLGLQYGERGLALAMENMYLALVGCVLFVALFITVHRLSSRWLDRE